MLDEQSQTLQHDYQIPSGLNDDEQRVYETLISVAKALRAEHRQAPHVIVISDLAKDYDDLAALLVLKELHRIGLIQLDGIIANLTPPRKRALYGRKALDSLGLQNIPIGVGTEATTGQHEVYDYEFPPAFMPDEEDFSPNKDNFFEHGDKLLDQLFAKAVKEDRKVTPLLISSLADINQYARANPEIFHERVERIYMQGSYSVSPDGILSPNKAANNVFHWEAAVEFHERIKDIPSVVYTKVAAYAAAAPAKLFSDLKATGHPVGEDLECRYKRQGVAFYNRACGPEPFNDITPAKFLLTQTNFYEKHPPGDGTPIPRGDEICQYLTEAILYDALPALATGGDAVLYALNVLDPPTMSSQTSIHKVVGTSQDQTDIPNIRSDRMAFVLSTMMKGSLLDSMGEAI